MESHPGASGAMDFAQGAPTDSSPLSQSVHQSQTTHLKDDSNENYSADGANTHRFSTMSQSNTLTPSRGGTLKKKQSIKRSGSLKRSSSRKSSRAGSVRSLALGEKEKYADGRGDETNSAFYTPVPTTGNPTEILANRFQAWRKVLKDLIAYFRDIQRSYEARSKSSLTVSNVINNTEFPPVFLTEGGIGDANHILRDYHKQSLAEGHKARSIEEDVIVQLTGLRSDLQQKIKEIKNLAGDFKNAVDKETEGTRKAVRDLQEALGSVDLDPSTTVGKGDPYIIKLGVDRQVEKQIDEENYLHRAFLNLENSGRELESIVVGEIQKAYNAYAGIIKREADEAYEAVERLRTGPVAMVKDYEWNAFVDNNEHFVDPRLPIRKVESIFYPGIDHPAASEVRAGLLERKSKYLKSYTPGWYVLSPTHLHEFKSADRISSQTPIMSLFLPEQKLGSHSNTDSSSHKFMLKGRQTGGLHRGHGWVFRAESYDTMLAWYEDIKSLTEKTGEERNAFVRRHARSVSAGSHTAGSISSEGALDEDEADQVPYSANASQIDQTSPVNTKLPQRPQPGGRFPSDINTSRDLHAPLSPSSSTSSDDRDVIAAASALPGSGAQYGGFGQQAQHQGHQGHASDAADKNAWPSSAPLQDQYITRKQQNNSVQKQPVPIPTSSQANATTFHGEEYNKQPMYSQGISSEGPGSVAYGTPSQIQPHQASRQVPQHPYRSSSTYGEWMAPAAAGIGGAVTGVAGVEAIHQREQANPEQIAASSSAQHLDLTQVKNLDLISPARQGSMEANYNDPGRFRSIPRETQTASPTNFTNIEPSLTSSISTAISQSTGFTAPTSGSTYANGSADMTRPALPNLTSVQTISDLHVPGEFPRTSTSKPAA